MAMTKEECQERDRNTAKCSCCGNNLSLDRQNEGIIICPACEKTAAAENQITNLQNKCDDCTAKQDVIDLESRIDDIATETGSDIEDLRNEVEKLKTEIENTRVNPLNIFGKGQ